jgi:serine phosphatase RsbU (regulator of sigma subunit)/anti-sigma regulatory factor (Ser/Thr protein kinase)
MTADLPNGRAGTTHPAARIDDASHHQARRVWRIGYGFAALSSLVAFVTMLVFIPIADEPLYALLVGAVTVSTWFAGVGPGLLSIAIGWSLSYVVFVGDPEAIDWGSDEDLVRWGAAIIVGLGVVWVSAVMRQGRERAAKAADQAVASVRDIAGLQELASVLAAAVTPSDVARALVERTARLLGARGGALGLIDGDAIVIVDPQSGGFQTHAPGARIPLEARAPIARAALTGRTIVVEDRQAFERDYPDGAALTPYAQGALALPLRAASGAVLGSMSFLYDEAGVADEDAETIATIAAELGGQSLERAQLYAREQESRRGLDRILRVAPRFHTDSIESASSAICREAIVTFGADIAVLWRIERERLKLIAAVPGHELLAPLGEVDLADFPTLREAIDRVQVSFVPNVQQEARGAGLERTRRLGIQSSLRTPIAIGGGEAELVLIVSWTKPISEPDPSTIVLLQRFADQAGFALEQVERRRAQAEAAVRADETRRLQEVTAALSLASTAAEVSDTCLVHALEAVGAEAGFIVLARPEGVVVDVVSSRGYSDDELERWGTFELDADVPFARAIASGEPVWALTSEEVSAFGLDDELPDSGWVALPLRTAAGVRGALHLSFRKPRALSDEERRWLQAVVSQCAQALERSKLFDAEQLSRMRSERLQSMTAALSNALTRADVANIVVDEIAAAMDASGTAVGIVVEDRQLLRTIAAHGYPEDVLTAWHEVPLDEPTAAGRALRGHASAFYETPEDLRARLGAAADDLAPAGHSSFLFLPLVAGRRVSGLLTVSWQERRSLSDEELSFVEALGGQAAQALDRAGHFESEQTIAETLQRSVLPVSLPRIEGVQLAARYLAGTAELDVGGDWFDAVTLPDGRVGLVVGDVVGKGVQAAATMAQLRNALRAFSLDRMKPSSTMSRLNRLAEEVVEAAFATIAYVVVDPDARVCRYTSAGHPPPLVAYPDGRVEFLEGGRGLPLGAASDTRYEQAVVELPLGSVLLLYTDGLIERRGRLIDDGLEQLRDVVRQGPREPEDLVEHILASMVESQRGDDIALLAVRLLTVAPRPLDLRVPSSVDSLDVVRDAIRAWLVGTPLERADRHDVVLAVWEACANSIEHGVSADGGSLRVRAEVTEAGVRISVDDTGRWVPQTERADRGLGLRLMHATMSSVDITPGSDGTRVILEKLAGAAAPES